MTRFIRTLLYWLARLAGLIGLFAGGKSLVKYVLARLKDPYFDSFSYNDLVFSGGVIFLLSILVLIFTDIGLLLHRVARSPAPTSPGLPIPPGGTQNKMTALASQAGAGPETEPVVPAESPDAKLARLLKQKEE